MFSNTKTIIGACLVAFTATMIGCKLDEEVKPGDQVNNGPAPVNTTPYQLDYPQGFLWPRVPSPPDNPLTEEGVALGRKLFYDKILSATNTMSCATCHRPENAFTDPRRFSLGLNGEVGTRNSMPLFNLYGANIVNTSAHRFMWDGAHANMETQVIAPITNPIEMNQNLKELEQELRNHPEYPALFKQAFGIDSITIKYVTYAISQFERTLISGTSKFDKWKLGQAQLTESELRGMEIFGSEDKGDCFHCHGNTSSPFFTFFKFHNNGLDSVPKDAGLFLITNNPLDSGRFKTPTLRNLSYTAPYMHDGRFNTLEEVVEFYNSGVKYSKYTDEFLIKHKGGLGLTEQEKADLIAFLKTLDDPEFVNNPKFRE